MDIITQRIQHERIIMKLIDEVELTDNPADDFYKIKSQLLNKQLLNDHNLTFAKEYFSEVMLKQKEEA